MSNYKIQLSRLKRRYESNIKNYDIISFLDLANTLRIWTEIGEEIDKLNTSNFKIGVLSNKVKNILADSEYVYSHLPDKITTSASATNEINDRNIVEGPMADKFSIFPLFKIGKDKELTIKKFLTICRVLTPE
mgnify:CR=1 FL=1